MDNQEGPLLRNTLGNSLFQVLVNLIQVGLLSDRLPCTKVATLLSSLHKLDIA